MRISDWSSDVCSSDLAGVAVRAVELPAEAGAADLYPTLPAIEALHNQIGIDEAALLRNTRGAFTLGQNFVHSSGAGRPSLLHSYGAYGPAIERGHFFPLWVRGQHHAPPAGLDL